MSRFRPVPGQDVILPYVAEHIARESVRRKGLRWRWKFDPAIFQGRWVSKAPAKPTPWSTSLRRCPAG